MASNMAVKAKAAESAQNNGAGSKLLLDGSKGRKGVWGTEVRSELSYPGLVRVWDNPDRVGSVRCPVTLVYDDHRTSG